MSPVAIILILASSVLHAGWNLLGKNSTAGPRAFFIANLTGMLLLLPVAAAFSGVALAIPGRVLVLLAVTGFFQMIYYVALSRAYRAGEMSVAYPLLRSLPIVMVAAVEFAGGGAPMPSRLALLGFLLIVAGCFLLPLRRFGVFRIRSYRDVTVLFALVAAVGTSGYSVVDSSALEIYRNAPTGASLPGLVPPIVYSFFEAVSSAAWVGAYLLLVRANAGRRRTVLADATTPAAPLAGARTALAGAPAGGGAPAPGGGAASAGRSDPAPAGAHEATRAGSTPAGATPASRGRAGGKGERPWRGATGRAVLMGIGIYLTYTIVLVSMGLVSNVAYVVAFRQASIPIGVAMSLAFLKERPFAPKMIGVAIITAGLVLTALG